MVTTNTNSEAPIQHKTTRQKKIEDKYGVQIEWILDTLHNVLDLPARNGIDEKLKISPATVADWMDRLGIHRRTISEDNHRRYKLMSNAQIKQQTKKANEHVREFGQPSNIGSVGWSRGLTKETNESLMITSIKQTGENNPMFMKRGESHPQWKGGARYYRLKDYELIKEKVKQRDGNMCTRCGCKEEDWKKAHNEQPLQVHHIEAYKISKNNDMDNLTTLCGRSMRKNTINGENDFVLTTETIVSIKRAKPGQVFNISVADDESYVANGIIVHNCRSRIVAYPYDYPGDRDFTKQTDGTKVTKKYGKSIDAQVTNFRTKYWKPAKVEIPDDLIAKIITTKRTEERIKALDYPADKEEIRDRYFDTVIKPDLNLDIDVADSVEKYTGNDYRLINTYLRDPKASLTEYGPVIDYEDMIEGAIKNIDSIMDRVSLEKDMVLYRGITANRAEELLKSGKITDAAYSSTSESIASSLDFTMKGLRDIETKEFQNIIVVQVNKGRKAIHYGGAEAEVILPRGVVYTVTKTLKIEELTYKTRLGRPGRLPVRFIYCTAT